MSSDNLILLNDDLFLNSLSCPLKYGFKKEDYNRRVANKLLFRQRNKLHLRDAVAMRFSSRKQTSKRRDLAAQETKEWLKMPMVAISGAVLQLNGVETRIPLLIKKGDHLTIVQVHGRLRKRSEGGVIKHAGSNRSIDRYLLKAAYRMEVVRRIYPEAEVEIEFYFPKRSFRARQDHLHLFDKRSHPEAAEIGELNALFAGVSATKGTIDISQSLPEDHVYSPFAGMNLSDALDKVLNDVALRKNPVHVTKHSECKKCRYRQSEDLYSKGCWSRYFSDNGIQNGDRHIYELIGQIENVNEGSNLHYQEQAIPPKGFEDFDKISRFGGPKITIKQRKSLQILLAKNEWVPEIWVKKGANILSDLKFPLHFLDFEAAAYAIPFKKHSKPYDSVYFQVSCHTLTADGSLCHTGWLDESGPEIHPHHSFIDELAEIPDIHSGTIVQYSPFEWQAMNRLIKEYRNNGGERNRRLEILQSIRDGDDPENRHRFFDFSTLIRDYYFNSRMHDGLGLKPVLLAILAWEHQQGNGFIEEIEANGNLHTGSDMNTEINPYENIQHSEYMINDGGSAMSAWISGKLGLLSNEERRIIPTILRNYCNLDSIALYVIYKHISELMKESTNEDLILYRQ
jgi:hypothetical protein